jgi:hypothetical protein
MSSQQQQQQNRHVCSHPDCSKVKIITESPMI